MVYNITVNIQSSVVSLDVKRFFILKSIIAIDRCVLQAVGMSGMVLNITDGQLFPPRGDKYVRTCT